MENKNLPGLTPVWIIVLSTALASLLPIAIPYIFKDDVRPADWLGFAGNIIVAGVALVAAVIAWNAVQNQIAAGVETERRRNEGLEQQLLVQQAETKEAALVVISQPVHAASGALFGIRKYIKSSPTANEMIRWKTATTQAMAQLEESLNHFSLRELAGGLAIEDRLRYLMVLSRLSTIVTLFNKRPDVLNEGETYMMLRKQLESLPELLKPFDEELASVFVRDSSI